MKIFNDRKARRISQIWLALVCAIFVLMLLTIMTLTGIGIIMFRLRYIHFDMARPLIPIAVLLISSLCVGAVFALIVGKRILIPLTNLIDAEKQIAGGNFTVRIDEHHRLKEFREMAVNFNVMAAELASIETLRNDFIVNVSHEFKTPLASIEGYAMLLQDEKLTSEERAEYTKNIISSTRQLSTLTGNILRLSKLENQEIIAEKHSFALDEQLRQTVILYEPQWSEKNLELRVELDHVEWYGSEDLMMQVWSNLIANAIKFTGEGGLLEVTLRSRGEYAEATVSDTGIGMDDYQMAHIFEKFYQGDKSRVSGGNGLGLALVKRILDLCDGTVSVSSSPGEGSSFTVRLPLAKEQAEIQ